MRPGTRRTSLGAVGLAISFWGLYRDVGFLAQPFYAYAWWSYILLLDGFVEGRRGGSLLSTRRRMLLPVAVWSVTFWFFFELLNLRFQNWYYVGVFAGDSYANLLAGAIFGVVCFATVFVGLFETYDALGALGLFRASRTRPVRLPAWGSYALQGLGAAMALLALGLSHWLAPLVWGSVTFVIEPWNYRHGARSLLRDVERGEVGHVFRLLVAGLVCGLVWESFNFFAPQKWIYTVRGLDELKLFEMPLLGFLGFPALALDAFAFFAFVSFWCHGNRSWESPEDVPGPGTRRPRPALSSTAFAATIPLHAVLWAAVSWWIQFANIGSVELRLRHLSALPNGSLAPLEERGLARPRRLLASLEDAEGRRELARLTGLDERRLRELRDEIRLLTFKGIGFHHGKLLRAAGIDRVEDLAEADPEALYREMERLRGNESFPALRPEMVRVWTNAARSRR